MNVTLTLRRRRTRRVVSALIDAGRASDRVENATLARDNVRSHRAMSYREGTGNIDREQTPNSLRSLQQLRHINYSRDANR